MKAYKGGKSSDKPNTDPNLLRKVQQYQKEGMNVTVNESGAKYSAMLLDLVKPHHGSLPDIDELEDLLDLAMIAWNIANMKSLLPHVYKIMLQETKKDLENDKDSVHILEKMIKEKEKKFAAYDLFIHHFDMETTDDDELSVTVTAKPLESFLSDSSLPGEKDDDEPGFNNEPGYINRNAFLVKPRQPFLDWLKKTEGNSLFPIEPEDSHIYLLEEKHSNQEIEEWLKKNFDTVFRQELDAWFSDEKSWPQKRTYEMFRKWFDISYHSMLYDLERFPVDKDLY